VHRHAVQGAPGVLWYAPSTRPGHPVLWNLYLLPLQTACVLGMIGL
jgi:hypothetical protein